MRPEDLRKALCAALCRGVAPLIFKIRLHDGPVRLEPTNSASYRRIPIDVTGQSMSYLLCENGVIIPVEGEW